MKIPLEAIHENELEILLKNLGVLAVIKEGRKKCKFTGKTITLENLHSIFPESGDIKFVSDSPEAIRQLSLYLNEKKYDR